MKWFIFESMNDFSSSTYLSLPPCSLSDMTLAHCAIWTPTDAARAFGICEKNLPARHTDINLVHLSLAAWAVLEFVKQFLSAKIKSRLVSIDNHEKLVHKLGREILPKEYGGESEEPPEAK